MISYQSLFQRLGNEDNAPCPRKILPDWDLNQEPLIWKSILLSAQPRQHLIQIIPHCNSYTLHYTHTHTHDIKHCSPWVWELGPCAACRVGWCRSRWGLWWYLDHWTRGWRCSSVQNSKCNLVSLSVLWPAFLFLFKMGSLFSVHHFLLGKDEVYTMWVRKKGTQY